MPKPTTRRTATAPAPQPPSIADKAGPIRLHPENPKLFEFRGRPLALVTATEHYGAVLNRPFRFERYLADAAEKGMTVSRLFALFRELQTPINPYSTCKPESTDFITPFRRVGPGLARDGQPKYDLTQWNDEYFDRLHAFLKLASEYGIIVELTLLSCTYNEKIWELNPLHAANNVNGLDPIPWQQYTSTRHAKLFDWQCAHVRRIVEQTNQYDNVIYEICNEPAGGEPSLPDNPSGQEVDQWQTAIAELIHGIEKDLPHRHLISGQQCAVWPAPGRPEAEIGQPNERAFAELPVDIVNVHPLSMVAMNGRRYDMGAFMGRQLRLAQLRDFALDTYALAKPLNYNEDNAASLYKDSVAWTLHRKRAWTTLLSGAHYDMIDFTIWPHVETGTPESQRQLRCWFGHLSRLFHSLDLARARPLRHWLKAKPAHVIESVLAVAGRDYCIYLADGRELDEPGAGSAIAGQLKIDLPDGRFEMTTFSPANGEWSKAVAIAGAADRVIDLPTFQDDLVVRLRRR